MLRITDSTCSDPGETKQWKDGWETITKRHAQDQEENESGYMNPRISYYKIIKKHFY